MITGNVPQYVNLTSLDQAQAEITIHSYLKTEAGLLPGAWSWTANLSVPRTNPALVALLADVLGYVLPVEQAQWGHFGGLVADIRLAHVDVHLYGREGFGMLVHYDRLGADGQPIRGFGGDMMLQIRRNALDDRGTGAELGPEFVALCTRLFRWAQKWMNENALKNLIGG